jgi:hypothetical protein
VLLATGAPIACVLRRGPTDWWHVARWDVDEHRVEHGAWLRAKIYPERCAVSPDGSLLAAFVLDGRSGSWGRYFAVSKLPWLHALAAWETPDTYTTGAHFPDERTLVLAGTVQTSAPFHGSFPGEVTLRPTDMHWTRSRLFRELNTGWRVVPATEPWVEHLSAPIAAQPNAVVAARTSPHTPQWQLVLVSLWEYRREYYLLERENAVPLTGVVWAEWDPARRGSLLAATSTGQLQTMTADLEPAWQYEMNRFQPESTAAPDWAKSW